MTVLTASQDRMIAVGTVNQDTNMVAGTADHVMNLTVVL